MAKILLVEDDNNLREIYQARLAAEGYDIVAAQDGEEALVVAKKEHPDLIISDVMMPRISGFEMLDILRNTDELKNVKVIMLTALGQAEDQARADNLGADKYLVKSQVTLEDIVKSAEELLIEAGAISAPEPAPAPVEASQPVAATTPTPVTPVAQPVAPAPAPSVAPTPVVAAPPVEPVAEPAPAPAPEPVVSTPTPEPAVAVDDSSIPSVPTITLANLEDQVASPSESAVENPKEPAPAVIDTPDDQLQQNAEEKTSDHNTAVQVTPPVNPDPNETKVAESSVSSSAPQTLEAEEAAIQAQINNFAEETTAPEPVAPKAPETPPTNANEAADDQVMKEAVDQLVSSVATEPSAQIKPVVAAAPKPEPEEVKPDPASLTNEQVPIAHKKVIRPLDTPDNKPNLQELLAREEANNILSTQSVAPAPVVNGQPMPGPTTTNPTNQDFDPNSVAL